MGKDVGDGILVGGLQVHIRPTSCSMLVKTLEFIHGTAEGRGRREEGGGSERQEREAKERKRDKKRWEMREERFLR